MRLFGRKRKAAAAWISKGTWALLTSKNYEEAIKNKKIAGENIKDVHSNVVEKYSLHIERAIYDPCKSDFIEGSLPTDERMDKSL